MIKVHLTSAFGSASLADLTRSTLQGYFANRAGGVEYPTLIKIRDTLSSILRSAVDEELLEKNPMDGVQLPHDKRPRRAKLVISPEQFKSLLELIPEPYATAVYVCAWTGLRVSELLGLKWRCIHQDSITVEERYCRGDWDVPKTEASAAPIAVEPHVLERIHRLKLLAVDVRAGCAVRRYKVVKADGPDDLVFQSVQQGKPMGAGNILKRFIKPAAKKLAEVACNLASTGGRGSKIRARPDAAFANLNDDGHLRPDSAGSAAAGGRETLSVCERVSSDVCPKRCPIIGPINVCGK